MEFQEYWSKEMELLCCPPDDEITDTDGKDEREWYEETGGC